MFLTMISMIMAVFAAVSSGIARRRGSGISRRAYGNIYSDATGARRASSRR